MKKLMILVILMIGVVGASSLGTYKGGECVQLHQICDNCTSVNLTSIIYPNGTIANTDHIMTKEGEDYNYTFCDTGYLGNYIYTTCGNLDGKIACENIGFEITGTGYELDEPRSLLNLGMLGLLVFFFIVTVASISFIPKTNVTDDYGMIIGINNLKHLRPVLWFISWILLMAILFVASGISLAYIGSDAVGDLFFVIYRIMFYLTLPMVIMWMIFIFVGVFRDKETKKMIERGVQVGSMP